jgi:hypothetical protein
MKKALFLIAIISLIAAASGADTLSALLSVDLRHDLVSVSGSSIAHDKGNLRISQGFIDGNATDTAQASVVYSAGADITSATAIIVDLNAITGAFGSVLDLATVKALAVRNTGESGDIILNDGADPFAPGMATATIITLPPQGAYIVAAPYAGYAVATPSYLHISTADDAASYSLVILGTQ